jgi:hypothetical protein
VIEKNGGEFLGYDEGKMEWEFKVPGFDHFNLTT